jgi:CO/xanthine dehydrogenase FAD-binding subunit
MFVKPFHYLRAQSVEEAVRLLSENSDAKLLAGGQSLMPLINLGLAQVDAVIDISPIVSLEGVTLETGDRPAGQSQAADELRIGALTRHRTLELDQTVRKSQPLLAEAVRHVGNPRVRNLGTLGGSLAHNDPAAELPLVMQVLDAECTVSNGGGTRTVPADEFFVSPFTTALHEDELLVSVRVPPLLDGWGWGFHEFALRTGDFAIVAAAAIARCSSGPDGRENGVIESVRAGLAGVADRAIRCRAFEAAAWVVEVDKLEDVAEAVEDDIDPVDDPLASAAYKRHLARVLTVRAVRDACRRAMSYEL